MIVLYILRGLFILMTAVVAALYVLPFQAAQLEAGRSVDFGYVVLMILVAITAALLVIGGDVGTGRKKLSHLSGVFLGLLAGLLAAYALSFVVDLVALMTVPGLPFPEPRSAAEFAALTDDQERQLAARGAYLKLFEGAKVFIGLVTCYAGISLVLQTKDDFRFVLPYVEFAKQIRGSRATLLDTSVIIDGRVLDIVETKLVQGLLIVPKFVLNELQVVADSPDRLRRARGRRGLEVLQKLQENAHIDVLIQDVDAEGGTVDQKLVALARDTDARVMTNDFNLNKIATLRGVDVINLHDLAKALRPVALPGELLNVRLVKPGESPTQGVGYLEDGTMVVVENGRGHIGHPVDLLVTSTIQTSAGRMIFGRFASEAEGGSADLDGGGPNPGQASDPPPPDARHDAPPPSGASSPPPPAPPTGPLGPGRTPPRHGRNPRRG